MNEVDLQLDTISSGVFLQKTKTKQKLLSLRTIEVVFVSVLLLKDCFYMSIRFLGRRIKDEPESVFGTFMKCIK